MFGENLGTGKSRELLEYLRSTRAMGSGGSDAFRRTPSFMCITNTAVQATSTAARLALPFREAGTAHHPAFAATNGDDPV